MKKKLTVKFFVLLSVLWVMECSAGSSNRSPSTEPILRLGTQMHFSTIRRISSDTSGRYILTCSEDKTARLWEGGTGDLVKILRVPSEIGDEGKLYACALSPDGKIAAVGGITGYKYSGRIVIYLFNTLTGEMIQRLSGMEGVIYDIEFYSNHLFAAALGGKKRHPGI